MNERAYPDIEDCEARIETSDELLYRQIAEHQWNEKERVPSSHAFGPSPADNGRPSFARSSVDGVDEQSSRDWHQKHARSRSISVWATTPIEVASVDLRAVDDSACPSDGETAPGHCYVDYRSLTKAEERTARAVLLLRAVARGEFETIDCLADGEGAGG